MGRWPNQAIDYDVSLMVRATGRAPLHRRPDRLRLDGEFHGKGDAVAHARIRR